MFQRSLFSLLLLLNTLCALANNVHELPRHRAYTWSSLSLEDLQGDICIPIIFINFTDNNNDNEVAVSSSNQQLWMSRLNDRSTSNHMGEDGSVNDYFLAQSYGKLNVTFENIGSYTAPGRGSNYTDYGVCGNMLRQAVHSLTDVDWSRYDSNDDMEVDCLLAIFAGHSDDDTSSRNANITSIYPHRYWMSIVDNGREPLGDGYYLESYVFANNLRHHSNSLSATNTICHELGHGILDLTDYYKSLTSYLGQYDAMCYGYRQMNYGASTDHCCDLTSFNRMYLGWITPDELTEPCHVRLNPLSTSGEACVIFDPADANHFFLLENRAALADSWDAHLPASGLVVVEVNWDRDAFEYHNVNSARRKNIRVICAATGQGLALPNDSYLDFDQSQVPYGIQGREAIQTSVHSLFATQTVTNIIVNEDHSVEFDFMGGGAGIEMVTDDALAASPCYDLQGQRIATGNSGFQIRNRRLCYQIR